MSDLKPSAPAVGTTVMGPTGTLAWRTAQTLVWVIGLGLLIALAFFPDIGIHAFWNVLIPLAPALLVFAPGIWRNVWPLGTTALMARHAGLSARRTVSPQWQARLALGGTLLLLAIVPLRHVVLDLNGPATAIAIGTLALMAVGFGFLYEWKSGWCSGLCPVHPVEKLYGSKPAITVPNTHCGACEQCVAPCLDSTPAINPLSVNRYSSRHLAGLLLVGGFPGFIWGWFQVPDYAGTEGWAHLGEAYGWPFLGLTVTLIAYLALEQLVPARHRAWLIRAFAAAAVACYYWYRVPALFGMGPIPGDGMLVDLRASLPAWFPWASRAVTTGIFAWWFLIHTSPKRPWSVRPQYA